MKKQALSLFLAGALALSLFGCSAQPAAESAPQSSPAETAGSSSAGVVEELHLGTTAANDTFTTFVESGAFGKMCYNSFVTAPFWQTGPNGEVEPFLVADWTVSEDSTTITCDLALDQGITWHDGEPLTMDDVLFTFDYNINVRKSSYGSYVDHAEQVDEDTIKVVLKEPGAYQWLKLVAGYFYVQPKHIWENIDAPKDYRGEDAVIGCGPYRFVSLDEDAQTSYYEAVSDTYLGREVTVKKVSLRSFDSNDALVMALRNGEIDAMYSYASPIPATMASSITGVEHVDPGMSDNTGSYMIMFGFRKGPTDDLNFRKAVTLSLDYELLAATIGGEDAQVPGVGVIAPPNLGYDETLPKLEQNLEAAKAALDEGGYLDVDGDGYREMPDGSPMDILVSPQNSSTRREVYLRIAEVMVQNLDAIGVKAHVDEQSITNEEYEDQLCKEGTYQIFICYCTSGMASQTSCYYYFIDNTLDGNWGTCDLPEFVEAYETRRQASDEKAYIEGTKLLQQINAEQYIGEALCWDKAYFPYRTDRYEGWTNYPGWGVINCETWYSLRPVR